MWPRPAEWRLLQDSWKWDLFAVLEAGEPAPTQRSVGKSQERYLRVLPPCGHLELLHSPPGLGPRFQPPPFPVLPQPFPAPWASLSQGAGRPGARPGFRLVGLGLLRPAFINPPQRGAQGIDTLPRRPALHPQASDGNESALPPVLTCSWASMSLEGPVPRPTYTHLEGQQWVPSSGLCCVDS